MRTIEIARRWKTHRAAVVAMALFHGAVACTAAAEVKTSRDATSEVILELGRDLYLVHCASCHGDTGRGGGSVASSLKSAPPDLTQIAARKGGDFSTAAVAALIDGREMPSAHGTREMPVWGRRFSERLGGGEIGEEAVRGHLLLLVEYLRSLQR
jgi:mono/diheme cytochrome c family protein